MMLIHTNTSIVYEWTAYDTRKNIAANYEWGLILGILHFNETHSKSDYGKVFATNSKVDTLAPNIADDYRKRYRYRYRTTCRSKNSMSN